MSEKVVLAYSGGLDTTALIPWLKENFGYEIICVCINCGQKEELTDDNLQERAIASGASKLYIEDVVDEFAEDFIMPCVQAGAVYEHSYLLGTSMARPLIAKRLVEIAHAEGAVAICHGATGKGNDQIRFELGIKALDPDIKIIAPWRMTEVWKMESREDEIQYCKDHGIDLPFSMGKGYSRDRNLWHISHEGLELEDPAQAPNYDKLLVLSVAPDKAPDKMTDITLTFENGVPTSLNGKEMKVAEIIEELNIIGGENGIGIIDIVENRVVGMKSRGVYETPGGTILMYAHDQLEELVLDRETMETKKKLGSQMAQVVYEGKWFTPLCDAIRAFVASTQNVVTGTVNLKLYKGNIIKNGTTSPYSLYNSSLASFTTGDLYDHKDASGFINLFGLPLKVRAMVKNDVKKMTKEN
ncbi:MAG: argininosuccinate synthase [Eubacteriales bacterium]|nr:argininosuccinate synthase [Eubacteriales bacterium]